jgi:dephospho-CoA kinase
MRVIGLTGGIGSGKSTVAGFLTEMGAVTVDLDSVGHDVLEEPEVREELVGEFGRGILGESGEIDRAALGRRVFGNPEALARLNAVTHPAIDRRIAAMLAEYRRRGVKVVVLEAAALLEAGRRDSFDEVWATFAPEATARERLAGRGDLSRAEAADRIGSQLTNEERLRLADVVIDTSGSREEVREKAAAEWRKLLERL